MKNTMVISGLARALAMTSNNVEMLVKNSAEAYDRLPEIARSYDDMLLDELSHLQVITLSLTEMLTDGDSSESNADNGEGTVFAARDLDDPHKTEEEDV